MTSRNILAAALLSFAVITTARPAHADRLDDLGQKIDALTNEMERLKLGEAAEPELISIEGFAPAASKVYQKGNKQVSVGGYGEMIYESFDQVKQNGDRSNKKDKIDFLRAILYVGYKYNDWITLNSEIEFEHATSGKNGEVGLEMLTLDLKPWDFLGFRTGLLLVPMGLTNEFHEPTTFHGVKRPNTESKIIPTTWRSNGIGIFGKIGPVRYKSYAVASLQAIANNGNSKVSGFTSGGFRGGRTKGSKSIANSWAWVTRLDVSPVEGTLVGTSLYTGRVDQRASNAPVSLTMWDFHGKAEYKGLEVKALYVFTRLSNVASLNAAQAKQGVDTSGNKSIGESTFGGYAEVAYDVFRWLPNANGHRLSPFFRYERYDTQNTVPDNLTVNPANSHTEYTLGVTYKPISSVVFKFDHQFLHNQANTGVGQTNLGFGYIF